MKSKSGIALLGLSTALCFISAPVNVASDLPSNVTYGPTMTSPSTLKLTSLKADEPGTGRDPGIFDLFTNFPRPFKVMTKPPPSTSPKPTTQNTQKEDQQVGSPGVEIPANFTLPLPVSVGGTTGVIPVSEVTVPSTEATWWGQVKYPCSCDGGTCGCCTGRILQNFNLNFQQRGCVNVTYYNEDFEFHVRMIWNERVFYQRRVSGKNPPPICIPLPRVVNLKFCVKFSNIYMIGRNMHMCIDIEGLLVEYQVFAFSFDCIRLGTNGFAVMSPEDGGGLGPPPDEDPYVPTAKPPKPPKPPKPQDGNKPKPQQGTGAGGSRPPTSAGNKPATGSKPGKPKPPSTTTEDYDAIVASEGDEIDSAKKALQL